MKSIKIWNDSPSDKQAQQIAERLKDGEIWIIPTDSLYGIMCDALNQKAVRAVCELKGINPEKNHLSVICNDISMAAEYARIGDKTFQLMRDNTPGAITFICKAQSNLPKEFKKRKTIGIRIPDNITARMISEKLGNPLLTTSIEFEDNDYAINPELIMEAYDGKVDGMAAGEEGATVQTTIIDCTDDSPEIIRQGKAEVEL
ncbi:MAG: threonylcarbamoyl-AMP synthase [Muribaculaceae bacterium]|nr:threonylcarbamoyl-AMP synthase [Muribaculaceae bacterium]